jgi:hypothetical protein
MGHANFKFTGWHLAKIAIAIILSYPLSGLAAAAWLLFRDFRWAIRHPWDSLLSAFRITIWFGIAVPVHGVLPIVDAAGHYHFDAYRYVIPTAIALIFVFFRGWRLFKVRQA